MALYLFFRNARNAEDQQVKVRRAPFLKLQTPHNRHARIQSLETLEVRPQVVFCPPSVRVLLRICQSNEQRQRALQVQTRQLLNQPLATLAGETLNHSTRSHTTTPAKANERNFEHLPLNVYLDMGLILR
jgi:hypothetical protein